MGQGLGRAHRGRPVGGLPPSGRRQEGPRGDTVCAAGGEPDISLRGPRRNVSITQAARTARAFPLPARLAGCRPLLAAPPGRRAGTLCKCNLSAGPAPAGKSRAGLPGTRRGAARSELEGGPFISGSDRESDARADGAGRALAVCSPAALRFLRGPEPLHYVPSL